MERPLTEEMATKLALILNEKDNVATALTDLRQGMLYEDRAGDREIRVTVAEDISFGHKLALSPIGRGDKIIKYGEVIGQATADIPAGTHVHVHNVESLRGRR